MIELELGPRIRTGRIGKRGRLAKQLDPVPKVDIELTIIVRHRPGHANEGLSAIVVAVRDGHLGPVRPGVGRRPENSRSTVVIK